VAGDNDVPPWMTGQQPAAEQPGGQWAPAPPNAGPQQQPGWNPQQWTTPPQQGQYPQNGPQGAPPQAYQQNPQQYQQNPQQYQQDPQAYQQNAPYQQGPQQYQQDPQAYQQNAPYQQDPQQAYQQGPQGEYADRPQVTVNDLTPQSLLRQRKRPPQTGWRKAVYMVSAHSVNPGESPADVRRRQLVARATVPVHGCYRIAVISLKGGVGKTTTGVCLGATLASLRGDRVIAVDANPDRGTLSGKIPLETSATVRNLLNDADKIQRYYDVRRYTSQSADRLEVLASETDPAVSIAFSENDYRTVAAILERFYNVVLTDCGTGLLHSAMSGVLALAHQLIVVSSGSVDGARSASATIDWLEAHGYGELVRGSVAVINSVRPKSGGVDLDKLEDHFAARCRAVTRIPYDPHLEEGAEVDLAELKGDTRYALLELAAAVADGFPRDGIIAPPGQEPQQG
jgi:MinD-like ATPase involved in chromosome partitioning or flagellar assembly